MRKLIAVVCLLWMLVLPIFAAGTLTVGTSPYNSVTMYTLTWVSDASGAVSGTTFTPVRGYIFAYKFGPDSGATQPTDLYDVEVRDSNANDMTISGGANLSNATSKIAQIEPSLFMSGTGTLELVVSNAGNAKGGTVYVYVRGETF